jgi:hypothetical protein
MEAIFTSANPNGSQPSVPDNPANSGIGTLKHVPFESNPMAGLKTPSITTTLLPRVSAAC